MPHELQVELIPLDRITIGERLRPVDRDYVELLAASMAETGQHTPIQVGPADAKGQHGLIAGAHRCAALKLAQVPFARAIVFEGTRLQAELLEVDENLMRRELSELDRAVFLQKRKAIFEVLHPDARRGGDRKSAKHQTEENFRLIGGQESFAAETAKKLGVSDRQVRTYLARARIEPDLRERLAGTRWADHGATLDALAKADPATRRKLVAVLTRANAPARTLEAARSEVSGPRGGARSLDDQQLGALQGAWRKASPKAREGFLAWLADFHPDWWNKIARVEERRDGDDEAEGESRVLRALSAGRTAA